MVRVAGVVLVLPEGFEADKMYWPASEKVVLVMVRLELVALGMGEPSCNHWKVEPCEAEATNVTGTPAPTVELEGCRVMFGGEATLEAKSKEQINAVTASLSMRGK